MKSGPLRTGFDHKIDFRVLKAPSHWSDHTTLVGRPFLVTSVKGQAMVA